MLLQSPLLVISDIKVDKSACLHPHAICMPPSRADTLHRTSAYVHAMDTHIRCLCARNTCHVALDCWEHSKKKLVRKRPGSEISGVPISHVNQYSKTYSTSK